MKLSKTSAHAALAIAFLAEQERSAVVQARHVAGHLGIPTDSALKILQVLARQELILSQLGRSGGYRLHKPAAQITLTQIVEAIDGPISGSMRLTNDQEHVSGSIEFLQAVCEQAATTLRTQLNRVTVADLVNHNKPVLNSSDGTATELSAATETARVNV